MQRKQKGQKRQHFSETGEVRNPIILQAFKREINLSTRVEADKTKYNRKSKYNEDY